MNHSSRRYKGEGGISSNAETLKSPGHWRELFYRPFLILFGVAILVRLILMLAYFPAVMQMVDSPRYARINSRPLFGDFWMPAGYPMLLQVLHAISQQMWVTIAIQHLLGLAVGPLLFLAVRRLGAPTWAACLAAAVPLLSGDHLYLEHVVMADFLLLTLATLGIMAAVYGLVPRLHFGWLILAGVSLAGAALTRSIGTVLVPISILCSIFWFRNSPRRLCASSLGIILPALLVFGLYCEARLWTHGSYLGLTDMSGWNLYARVAPFADCHKFVPPGDTAILCEERPPSERPGSFGYVWDLGSTARRVFPLSPQSSKKIEPFAWRTISHQPFDYFKAVLIDVGKYFDLPFEANRPYGGQSRKYLSFGWRDETTEKLIVKWMATRYRGARVTVHGRDELTTYQDVFRLNGVIVASSFVLTIIGMFRSQGPIRLGVWLFGLSAFGLYLVPVLTLGYTYRYGIPAGTFLITSGVLGAVAIQGQRSKRESEVGA